MKRMKRIAQVRAFTARARLGGRCVGLVPTMGALHEGHLQLVRYAQRECDSLVVSVFVNPTQFGPEEDFPIYPRTLEQDCRMLEEIGVEAVFAPEASEVYPARFDTWVVPGALAERLEGAKRPGHFRGVATIVLKLLNMVGPQAVYFGQKDYQQMLLIRRMVRDLDLDIEVVSCPTVREPDGVAMSSRNAYLEGEDRPAAQVLYRSLRRAEVLVAAGERRGPALENEIRTVIQAEPRAHFEYAEVVHPETLDPVDEIDSEAVALVAARIGPARLIDNTILKL